MRQRLVLLFLLIHLWIVARADSVQMEACAPVKCGSVNISYPFWSSDKQRDYCGYPSLEIACRDEKPFLVRTYDEHYYIDTVFYDNSSFVVIDSILVSSNTSCSVPTYNLSFGLGPMEVSTSNKELLFFFNCGTSVSNASLPSDYLPVTCQLLGTQSDGGTNESFVRLLPNYSGDGAVVPEESLSNCGMSRIPVSGWNGSTVDQYITLMNDGFLVELIVTSCSNCQESGGMCGYNTNTSIFMCICPDGNMYPTSCSTRKDGETRKIIIGSATAGAFALIVLVVLIFILRTEKLCIFQRKYRTQKEIAFLIEKYGSFAPKRYSYKELKRITKSFQVKLGKGGFGTVYKGSLTDGRLVAVKFLHESETNGEEFVNEVVSIGRTSHVNVVSLLGFCIESSKRALIYEYMSNGSLENYIHSDNPKIDLGWEKLYEIAVDIARAIEYLHRGCNTRIVHFDIKPQNILLDEGFRPKISDFGLAKLCRPQESIISLAGVRGTIGFIAPEVFSRSFGLPSTKSDVYSYGMVVLEMVGGRANAKSSVENLSQGYIPYWIYDHLVQGDQVLECDVTDEIKGIVRKMAIVGLWCIQTLPANRPSMSEAVEMLEKNLGDLEMPPKPYLSSPQHTGPLPNSR